MRALAGKDEVSGGDGGDTLYGGSYADKMFGGNGRDETYGGRGNDFISSVGDDSRGDFVDCGPGTDTVNRMPGSGAGDTLRNCEKRVEKAPSNRGARRRGWTPGRGRSRSGLVGTKPQVRRSVTHGMGPRRPGRGPPTNIPDHIEGGPRGDPRPGG